MPATPNFRCPLPQPLPCCLPPVPFPHSLYTPTFSLPAAYPVSLAPAPVPLQPRSQNTWLLWLQTSQTATRATAISAFASCCSPGGEAIEPIGPREPIAWCRERSGGCLFMHWRTPSTPPYGAIASLTQYSGVGGRGCSLGSHSSH